MFNLFKKGKDKARIKDKIWMTQAAKWKALATQLKNDPNTVFIFWFDDTFRQVEKQLDPGSTISNALLMAREAHSNSLSGKTVIFAEHYPLLNKEEELFAKLNAAEIQVWSGLDEPLFKQFGSDKIIQMMKQLGMKEDDAVEHNMISKAIQNAQEKISKKILIDQSCQSQDEWMRRNWINN